MKGSALIGGAVGGGVLVLILTVILAIVLFCKIKKQGKKG